MKKTLNLSIFLGAMALIMLSPSFVLGSVNGDDDATLAEVSVSIVSDTSSNGDDDTSLSGDVSDTGTVNSGTTNGSDDISTSGDKSNTSGTVNSGTTNGDDDSPVVLISNPNQDNNPSSGSSGHNRGGTRIVKSIKVCPLVTEYMQFGTDNNRNEVLKLQSFLKLNENANLDINGIFDEKTLNAVKNFQNKYLVDTMSPWGADVASGNVYITTLKKINDLFCSEDRNFTAEELAIIDSYKAEMLGSFGLITDGDGISDSDNLLGNNGIKNINGKDNSQTASAKDATSGSKIMNLFRAIIKFLINR